MNRLLTIISLFLCINMFAQVNRSFNGTNNNISNSNWGSAELHFRNLVSNGFNDLISEPGGQTRENPRVISNTVGSQIAFTPNEYDLSDFVWGWGQFIDHDINFNDDNVLEPNDIPVPTCESIFDPTCTGIETIRMFRSKSDPATGTAINNPRKTINDITSYIDGSGVYGSDLTRVIWLRTNVDGKMKISSGELLPWNTSDGEFDSPIDPSAPFMILDGPQPNKYYVGGDIRINEQPGLSAFHTLWVREHNRLCDELKIEHPTWTDEQLFQRARKIVGALIQVVTYEEFLPNIGIQLDPYLGYDDTINAGIFNTFSAASYRFGHTLVNGRLMRYEENGDEWSFGAVDLRDGFFTPSIIKDEGGIEPFLRGLAAQEHQMVDPLIMDDIRNFLFGQPGSGGIDLLAVNVARGRERGLPDYNTIRSNFLLAPHPDFDSLTSNVDLSSSLSTIYNGNINDIDPWIGFMSEDHLPNSIVGEGLDMILKFQFTALRDGDRYYYENDPAFSTSDIESLKATKLSEIVLRNTSIITLQENVFIAVPRDQLSVELFPFPEIKNIKLKAYPNPVQKFFNLIIESSRSSNATLSFFTIEGQLIRKQPVIIVRGRNELNFELSDQLANGLYIISLDSDSGQGQLKLIKRQE